MRNRPEIVGTQKRREKCELVYYKVEETVYIHAQLVFPVIVFIRKVGTSMDKCDSLGLDWFSK